ncbi:MAG TPA: metallophosphoesterase [Bacteroidota bacterium]|nr:metallophosphoesterase [Bacteroidota bacterium]
MVLALRSLCVILALALPEAGAAPPPGSGGGPDSLTVIAMGDCGEAGGVLRGCAAYVANMHTGQHDAGKFDLLLFLGDMFTPTGLNIPRGDVRGAVDAVLEPFRETMEDLGRDRCIAVPGEHDYYARNAIESSVLLGLVKIREAPIGLTDAGVRREAAIPLWTYHFGMPAEAAFPIRPGGGDSVQFIFFDSAIPLRTPAALWSPALRALGSILAGDRARPHIAWRVLCDHHPFVSAGEHGGYTAWDEDAAAVAYVPPCDRDSSALSWLVNRLDPEDLCASRYASWIDSVKAVVRGAGVRIQCALSAHDHSLQLIAGQGADTDPFPSVQIIAGAAAAPARVRYPVPPRVFTSAITDPSAQGESLPGFVRLAFGSDCISVVFYNGNNGDPIDMGGGHSTFTITKTGRVVSK